MRVHVGRSWLQHAVHEKRVRSAQSESRRAPGGFARERFFDHEATPNPRDVIKAALQICSEHDNQRPRRNGPALPTASRVPYTGNRAFLFTSTRRAASGGLWELANEIVPLSETCHNTSMSWAHPDALYTSILSERNIRTPRCARDTYPTHIRPFSLQRGASLYACHLTDAHHRDRRNLCLRSFLPSQRSI